MQKANFGCRNEDANDKCDNLVSTFRNIADKHVHIKRNTLRGNQAPFMTPDLRKAIYNRSRLKNNLNKNQTYENRIKYKKQRKKCVSLRKKSHKVTF